MLEIADSGPQVERLLSSVGKSSSSDLTSHTFEFYIKYRDFNTFGKCSPFNVSYKT